MTLKLNIIRLIKIYMPDQEQHISLIHTHRPYVSVEPNSAKTFLLVNIITYNISCSSVYSFLEYIYQPLFEQFSCIEASGKLLLKGTAKPKTPLFSTMAWDFGTLPFFPKR